MRKCVNYIDIDHNKQQSKPASTHQLAAFYSTYWLNATEYWKLWTSMTMSKRVKGLFANIVTCNPRKVLYVYKLHKNRLHPHPPPQAQPPTALST